VIKGWNIDAWGENGGTKKMKNKIRGDQGLGHENGGANILISQCPSILTRTKPGVAANRTKPGVTATLERRRLPIQRNYFGENHQLKFFLVKIY
jgi:hypothetical protein